MWTERRWLPAVLGLSLLGNVFLIGLIIGLGLAREDRPSGPRPLWGRTRALAPEERQAFAAVMHGHRDAIAAKRKALRAARAAAEGAIAAPAYDEAAVAAAFTVVRDAATAVQETTQAAVIEALRALTPEARAKLVRRPDQASRSP